MNNITIGVDFGGTSIKLAKIQGAEIIEKYEPIKTPDYKGEGELKDELLQRLIKLKDPSIQGVGIGVPGLVRQPQGTIIDLGNVKGWTNITLAADVTRVTGLPCKVDNDANCAALAEARFGVGQNQKLMLMVTLGTGVGSGIVKDGDIWHGAYGYAGEIGRLQIPSLDPDTSIISYEILDKICGHSAISGTAKKLYLAQGITEDLESKTDLAYLAEQARQGDELAKKVWSIMAENLALGLANANALLNPSMIVIGGGVAAASDVFLAKVKSNFAKLTWSQSLDLEITVAEFGNDAGLIGAAQLMN